MGRPKSLLLTFRLLNIPTYMYCLAPSLLLLLSRTISKSHNNAGWPPCVGQQKTQNRISYSRWAFNNACQVGRSWKGQPNLIHPISERRNGYMVYSSSFPVPFPKRKKEKNGTYQPFYKKSPSTFILLTQKQKKSM